MLSDLLLYCSILYYSILHCSRFRYLHSSSVSAISSASMFSRIVLSEDIVATVAITAAQAQG